MSEQGNANPARPTQVNPQPANRGGERERFRMVSATDDEGYTEDADTTLPVLPPFSDFGHLSIDTPSYFSLTPSKFSNMTPLTSVPLASSHQSQQLSLKTELTPGMIVDWAKETQLEERANLALSILLTLPSSMLASIHSKISPLLQVDILGRLPIELSRIILAQLDVIDLLNCSLTCKRYYNIINADQLLWKSLYVRAGWKYDKEAVAWWGEQAAIALQREKDVEGDKVEIMEMDEGMGGEEEEEHDSDPFNNTKWERKQKDISSLKYSIDETINDEEVDGDYQMSSDHELDLELLLPTPFRPPSSKYSRSLGLPPSPRHKAFPPPSHSIPYNLLDRPRFSGLPATPKDPNSSVGYIATPPFSRKRKSSTPSWVTPTRHHDVSASMSTSNPMDLALDVDLTAPDSVFYSSSSPNSTVKGARAIGTCLTRLVPTDELRHESNAPPISVSARRTQHQRRGQQNQARERERDRSEARRMGPITRRVSRVHMTHLSVPTTLLEKTFAEQLAPEIYGTEDEEQGKRKISKEAIPRTLDVQKVGAAHWDSSGKPVVNWRYMYATRTVIDRNWRKGRYTVRTLSSPSARFHSSLNPHTSLIPASRIGHPVPNPHSESIYCIQFSSHPHSSLLVTGSRDATVKAWDMSTGRCLRTYRYHSGSVLCLQFEEWRGKRDPERKKNDDDKGMDDDDDDEEGLLVSGSSDGDIVLWELATGKRRMILKGHRDSVLGVKFAGELLASCSKDRTIKLWSTVTGDLLGTLEGHRRAVNAVQIDRNQIVSASGDREIRVWDLQGNLLRCIDGHERGIAVVQCLGNTIVSGGSDCSIRIFDAITGKSEGTIEGGQTQAQTLMGPHPRSNDAPVITFGSLALRPDETASTINPVPLFGGGHTDLVRTLQFDDRYVVSGSYDETIKIWDRKTRKLLVNIVHAHAHRIFKIQYDITKIVSCSQDQKVYIWDFGHNSDVSFMAF